MTDTIPAPIDLADFLRDHPDATITLAKTPGVEHYNAISLTLTCAKQTRMGIGWTVDEAMERALTGKS